MSDQTARIAEKLTAWARLPLSLYIGPTLLEAADLLTAQQAALEDAQARIVELEAKVDSYEGPNP